MANLPSEITYRDLQVRIQQIQCCLGKKAIALNNSIILGSDCKEKLLELQYAFNLLKVIKQYNTNLVLVPEITETIPGQSWVWNWVSVTYTGSNSYIDINLLGNTYSVKLTDSSHFISSTLQNDLSALLPGWGIEAQYAYCAASNYNTNVLVTFAISSPTDNININYAQTDLTVNISSGSAGIVAPITNNSHLAVCYADYIPGFFAQVNIIQPELSYENQEEANCITIEQADTIFQYLQDYCNICFKDYGDYDGLPFNNAYGTWYPSKSLSNNPLQVNWNQTNPLALDFIQNKTIFGYIEEGTNISLTGSGTIADPFVINSLGGAGSQNLQSVTDTGYQGYYTTNPLISTDTINEAGIGPGYVFAENNINDTYAALVSDGSLLVKTGASGYGIATLKATNVINNSTFEFPDKPTGTYTLATLDDLNIIVDTYDNILALATANNLKPGLFYTISDFNTVHRIIGTTLDNSSTTNEPLTLKAISNNSFSLIATSILNPNDIIHYSLIDTTYLQPSSGSKGVIIYREDTSKGNSTHFDFREVIWRRWEVTNSGYNYYAYVDTGFGYYDFKTLDSTNSGIKIGYNSYNVCIDVYSYNIIIADNVGGPCGITIGAASYAISIDSESCQVITMGSGYVGGIYIGSGSRSISIGKRSYNIAIGNDVYGIELGTQNSDIFIADHTFRRRVEKGFSNLETTIDITNKTVIDVYNYGAIVVIPNVLYGGAYACGIINLTSSNTTESIAWLHALDTSVTFAPIELRPQSSLKITFEDKSLSSVANANLVMDGKNLDIDGDLMEYVKFHKNMVDGVGSQPTDFYISYHNNRHISQFINDSNYIPYTGAAGNVDLGTYGITTNSITLPGVISQYVRGDGTIANFPSSTGGGASVSYYLNGSVNQGTIGGAVYKKINKVPVIGTGTDFTINADGYIAQFITDAGDPNKLLIPAGNWNFETYFSADSGGGTPRFYIELSKYDGALFTPIASNSATPEYITGGTNIDLYFTALAVPETILTLTDRLAVRFYVIHSSKTITMHTENSHLSQIITTFSSGLTALNGLTAQVQTFATPGTTGTAPAWSSSTSIHTLNIPLANATGVTAGLISKAQYDSFLTANQSITLTGDVTGSGATSISTAIGNNKVTNAMLAQVATATFKGRTTASTGNVEDLTATQATALLNTFTSTLKGLTPSSGGGTTNFLRADGSWAAPAGGGGSMTYPSGSGIAVVSSGTSWGTTLTAPSGTIVGTSDTQTLTNKTIVKALNPQSSSYTLALTDASKVIQMGAAGANSLIIPASGSVNFAVGTEITIIQTGAGQTTISGPSVTLNSMGGWLKIAAQYGAVTLLKVSTAPDEWYVFGALTP